MKTPRYLFPSDYMADPSANVFGDRLYIFPSHDRDSGEAFDDDGGHFQMKDYHVLSLTDVENGEVTDHGMILDVEQVPWAERQMWDNDVVEKDGKYYLVFSAKDPNGVFHLGVAVADKPEGPFLNPTLSVARSVLTPVSSKTMTDKSIVTSVVCGADNCNGTPSLLPLPTMKKVV